MERNTRSKRAEILNKAMQDIWTLSEIITTIQNSPNGHSFGKINDITEILHFSSKGAHIDTIEKILYLL